jgi:putative nucleotidyltransferase with HDIG domain
MIILPQVNIQHQTKTADEISTYLSVFQDIGCADFVLWLMRKPESDAFYLDSALGLQPPGGNYPNLLAWGWDQKEAEIVENKMLLGEFSRWIEQPVFNLLNLPVSYHEKLLGFVQIVNFKDLPTLKTQENLAELMGHYLITHQQLMESNQWASRLQQLLEFIGSISSSLDPDQILRMLLEQVSLLLDAEACSLYLIDDTSGEAILHLSSRSDHRLVENYRIPQGKGLIQHVIAGGETLVVNDVLKDKRYFNGVDVLSNFQTRSVLAVALISNRIELGKQRGSTNRRIIGGLEILNKMNGGFSKMDVSLAEIFASQAATIQQTAQIYNHMDDLMIQLLTSLMHAVDVKDPYTKDHSKFVSEYAAAIGLELGLPAEDISQLRLGGLLHDVGKIGIPDDILKKMDSLTKEEFQEIYKHPQIGYKIVEKVSFKSKDVLRAIIEHHERLDGSGYPLGLRGNEISLVGRIMAVADSFHAMISDRPYRLALSHEKAFEELRKFTDIQYDERCVQALKNVYDMGKIVTNRLCL